MNDGKDKLTFGDYPPELFRFFEERESMRRNLFLGTSGLDHWTTTKVLRTKQ